VTRGPFRAAGVVRKLARVDTIAADLLLLAINSDNGQVRSPQQVDCALMGSELIRLAAAGLVEITGGRITVLDQSPTGDGELDAALASIAGARWRPRPGGWVGSPRPGIREAYLNRLAQAGAVRARRHRLGGNPGH
jgi:hypothetical protein